MQTGVRKASPNDIPYLANNLREADKNEIDAATYGIMSPQVALLTCLFFSEEAWVGTLDDNPVVMWGVNKDGLVWLLGTDNLFHPRIIRDIASETPKWLASLHARHQVLHNKVHAANTAHIKWIKRMGFTFLNRTMVGTSEFLTFARIQPCA